MTCANTFKNETSLTLWCRAFCEKLIVNQQLNQCCAVIENQGFLPLSQKSIIGLSHVSVQATSHLFLLRPILILPSCLCLDFATDLFPSGFPTEFYVNFSLSPYTV